MRQDTQDFKQLRRLLAIKRHEQPPPGYFRDFSQQVIIRIQAGESGEQAAFVERLLWEAPWLKRFWEALEAKPILAGVVGVALCGLLITGMVYSDRAEVPQVALLPTPDQMAAVSAQTTNAVADHPLLARPGALAQDSSTSPLAAMPAEAPILGDITKLRAQPVSFTFPSGN
ncbi:MAG TPA: hypothetical protein PKI20_06760 [Verrucomicrobiota bacterium]|jgi:hypothetical protein|nr:hypothetical protein [Verrucomicrobiota bacterium]HQL79323.1 hypothetical protein [Verrucomicrobiota bacterium]